jgi:WD40 repeat protein
VVAASADNTARLWDVATGQSRATLFGHTGGVESAIFSLDGLLVVTASDDGTARLWDTATGQPRTTLTDHLGGLGRAVLSPDGQLVVTTRNTGIVQVWDVDLGHLVQHAVNRVVRDLTPEERATYQGVPLPPPARAVTPGTLPPPTPTIMAPP